MSLLLHQIRFARDGFGLGPIDLEVPRGARTALIGPSGAGKTTLLRLVAGLERPTSGAIRFGDVVFHEGRTDLAPERRRVGFVFQGGALWPHMTALEHVRFAAGANARGRAADLLASVGLGALMQRKPPQLSGGEAQRLALARALASAPELLLLDEPLASVDVHLRDELALLLRRVTEEHRLTTLVVTHDREDALALADRLAVLVGGELLESGPAAGILRRPRTAFAARFLAQAACLPARIDAGRLVTAFGAFPLPDGAGAPHVLVLMPGDAAVSDAGPARGRVVQVIPGVTGAMAWVDVDGHAVRARLERDAAPGDVVNLRLVQPPLILPEKAASEGDPP